MGMFDMIKGTVTCPHCGKETFVEDQIKWLDHDKRTLHKYTVGEKIDVTDGKYTWGSYIRPMLLAYCDSCEKRFYFAAEVSDGIIKRLYSVDAKGEEIKYSSKKLGLGSENKQEFSIPDILQQTIDQTTIFTTHNIVDYATKFIKSRDDYNENKNIYDPIIEALCDLEKRYEERLNNGEDNSKVNSDNSK